MGLISNKLEEAYNMFLRIVTSAIVLLNHLVVRGVRLHNHLEKVWWLDLGKLLSPLLYD